MLHTYSCSCHFTKEKFPKLFHKFSQLVTLVLVKRKTPVGLEQHVCTLFQHEATTNPFMTALLFEYKSNFHFQILKQIKSDQEEFKFRYFFVSFLMSTKQKQNFIDQRKWFSHKAVIMSRVNKFTRKTISREHKNEQLSPLCLQMKFHLNS